MLGDLAVCKTSLTGNYGKCAHIFVVCVTNQGICRKCHFVNYVDNVKSRYDEEIAVNFVIILRHIDECMSNVRTGG